MARASLVQTFRNALDNFLASKESFALLKSIPSTLERLSPSSQSPLVYVLDSSFNPPTLAHARIALSALSSYHASQPKPPRLLLLLAVQNADKGVKPEPFEKRLALMTTFAEDLHESFSSQDSDPSKARVKADLAIDVGVTKHPYFTDKAAAISSSGAYGAPPIEQVHLVGFDTLIRLFNTKYYPPEHTLDSLGDLFKNHRLRVTYRTGSDWGERAEQYAYLQDIKDGKRESEGGKAEWAEKIEMVEGRQASGGIISSTRIREAVQSHDEELVRQLCTSRVAQAIFEDGLYQDT
ncbi:hypothetical protein MMC25_002022 [Agyrium rufum]|nr:hypothetical protein [Agyrium rufum]